MNVFLELTSSRSAPTRVRLKPVTVIGRSKQCQLRIASNEVSREHCRISLEDEGVFLVDLGSSNGTAVDGQTIKPDERIKLADGSKLLIGPAQFIVHIVQLANERWDLESTVDRPPNASFSSHSGAAPQVIPDHSQPIAPALGLMQRRTSVTADDDSFLAIGDAPLNDTALLNPGPVSTRLGSAAAQDISDVDTVSNAAPATWPGLPGAETPVISQTVDDRPATDRAEETPATKRGKLFSLFSLLKRSGSKTDAAPQKSNEADRIAPRQEGNDSVAGDKTKTNSRSSDNGTDATLIAPCDQDDVYPISGSGLLPAAANSETAATEPETQDVLPDGGDDDLGHFLKGLR